jgi:hypothetical protein
MPGEKSHPQGPQGMGFFIVDGIGCPEMIAILRQLMLDNVYVALNRIA